LAVFSLAFALIFPGAFNNSFYIFSHPLTEFVSPQKFFFVISPGNEELVKYSDLRIGIDVEGEKPKNVNLFWRNEGSGWNKEKLSQTRKSGGVKGQETSKTEPDFSRQFKEVKRNFEYYAEAKGIESERYRITVVDKPRVVGLRLTFLYPRYTRLETQVVDENDGTITALGGTKVKIEARSNKELRQGEIVFSDSTRKKTRVEGNVATAEIVVRRDASYSIQLQDKSGNRNQDPIEYKITRLEDQFPFVEILEPGHDRDLTESMRVGLLIRISDDYGFSRLEVVYQAISEGIEQREKTLNVDVPYGSRTELNAEYLWNLSNLPLMPGDLVRYRAAVYDNDSFSGPKKAESKSYFLRLPSLDEIIAEVEREQEGQIVDLETVLRGQKELKKKIEDLSQEMNRFTGLDMDWQKKQQLEDALDKQQKLAKDLDKVAQRMDENIKKVEENKLVALEMVEKMMEIKELMKQVTTPEMKEAMRKLAEALKNMDPDELKEAMKKMQLSAEEMLKRLDRTISLLKRLQAEQKLSHLIKMAERMTEKQNQLNQNTETSPKEDLPQLAPDEEQLKDDLNEFEKGLQEFSDLATELSLLPQEQLQELSEMPEESGVRDDMSQMISQLSNSNKSGSMKSGKSCSKKLRQMSDQLKAALDEMQAEQKEEILQAIRKSLFDVFSLSDNEERLFDQVDQIERRDMALRDLAHDQQNIKSAGLRISEDLEALSRLTLYIDADVLRFMTLSVAGMEQAIKNLDERKKPIAQDEQREAIYDLNVTARKLMQAMKNVEKSCSGSGMEQAFKKLQGMCDKQGGINEQTEQLGQCQGQGMQLSLSQQGALQRLAAEQEAVRKALSELEGEFGNRSEIMGRLGEMGEEMKKVVGDLERLQVDQSTIDRQKKILSRLLDAEKSTRERDYSRQRRAEVGEDVSRASPKELTPEGIQMQGAAKDDPTRFMQEAYPKEYEQLIKEYFKALSEERLRR
jgi:DNA repair exonuclease SbcCD ATPase subunit